MPPDASKPLPGIETELGLRRTMNKQDLYERVLRDFYLRFHDAAARIEAARAGGQQDDAARLAHTVKGLAGVIGAITLQEAARQLEAALHASPDEESACLACFTAELSVVCDGIAAAFGIG